MTLSDLSLSLFLCANFSGYLNVVTVHALFCEGNIAWAAPTVASVTTGWGPPFGKIKINWMAKSQPFSHIFLSCNKSYQIFIVPIYPKNHTDTHLATMFLEQSKQKKTITHTHTHWIFTTKYTDFDSFSPTTAQYYYFEGLPWKINVAPFQWL